MMGMCDVSRLSDEFGLCGYTIAGCFSGHITGSYTGARKITQPFDFAGIICGKDVVVFIIASKPNWGINKGTVFFLGA